MTKAPHIVRPSPENAKLTAVGGTRFGASKELRFDKPSSSRVCNASIKDDYLGAELERNPGLTPDRFDAFDLPSLVNGVRVAPKRITAMCVGAAGPVSLQSSAARRFAA